MYTKLDRSHDGVIGYELSGTITEAEFKEMIAEFETAINEAGELRLLIHTPRIPTFEFALLDEDFGFWLSHRHDIERYAVVGDGRLLEWATRVGDRITGIDVRHFKEADIETAWEWLEAE